MQFRDIILKNRKSLIVNSSGKTFSLQFTIYD